MDPWINSLVQSPLVRSLNTVPSRMSSFAYGVRDNVPPFSFTKEVVDQSTGNVSLSWEPVANTLTGTVEQFDFRIPESGLLDRMYLRVRMYSQNGTRLPLDAATTPLAVYNKSIRDARSSSMNFGSILEQAVLRTTGNKEIETLYPTAIAAQVEKMPSAQREFWYQCLNGFAAGTSTAGVSITPFSQLYNPYAQIEGQTETNLQNLHADFLIPLPFSMMDQLKDNFQTRFVDDLTVNVKLRVDSVLTAMQAGATGFAGFRASLVCVYHNFHDVIENSIRDQNFKRGFPASVYTHTYYRENTFSVVNKKIIYRLANKHLISELYCGLQYQASSASNAMTSLPPSDGTIGPFKFTLYGSGRQIWSAYSWELSGPDVADYQLADAHAYGEDLSHPILADVAVNRSIRVVASVATQMDRVTLGFPHLYSVRFGFQAHDNFYTGGLALQTLSNPTLEIESLGSETAPWDPSNTKFKFDVILKACQMLRIDSDTGVITTSLDV